MVAYTILFVYVCYFCWIMQKLLFSRVIDSLFQNIFSGVRCYIFKLPLCLVAIDSLCQYFISIVYITIFYISHFYWIKKNKNSSKTKHKKTEQRKNVEQ